MSGWQPGHGPVSVSVATEVRTWSPGMSNVVTYHMAVLCACGALALAESDSDMGDAMDQAYALLAEHNAAARQATATGTPAPAPGRLAHPDPEP